MRLGKPARASGTLARHRLRGSAEFDDLFRRGRRIDGPFLQVLARRAHGPAGLLGFVVSRKLLGRAVDRNRVRRLVREAVRHRRPAIDAYDVIVRLRRTPVMTGPDLRAEIASLLDRLVPDARP